MAMIAPVEISSRYPVCIEVDADRLGQIFAELPADHQVAVFRAMIEHMKPHAIQWDYISIELEIEQNADILRQLREVLFPEAQP